MTDEKRSRYIQEMSSYGVLELLARLDIAKNYEDALRKEALAQLAKKTQTAREV